MNTFTTKLATLLLILFLVLYAVFQGWRSFTSSYRTENAYEFEIARYCSTEGLLVRTEEEIQATASGQVRYLLEEGEKFRADTPIAQVFPSQEEAAAAVKQGIIRQERDLLEVIQRSTDTSRTADVESLNREIALSLRRLTQSAAQKDMEEVSRLHLALVEDIGRQQLVTGQNTGFEERIRELNGELNGGGGGQNIYSSKVGYFSRYVDGYEEAYTPELLEELDTSALREILAQDYPNDPDSFGKSVTDFTWYYATIIPKVNVESFYIGANVELAFIGGGEETVPGRVVQLRPDENGDALVVIRSTSITANAVSHRTASVKISFSNYKGLRISRRALRILDGQKGVYVRSGYSVRFKKVDIIYTGPDYYLCRTQYGSSDQLNLFDEVIVEGTDLYDGKPINP